MQSVNLGDCYGNNLALLYNFTCKDRKERLSRRKVLAKKQQNFYLEWRSQ